MRKNKIQVVRGTGRLAGGGAVSVHDAQGTPTTMLRAAQIVRLRGHGHAHSQVYHSITHAC